MEQQTPKMRQNSLKYLCFQQTGITVGLRRRIPDGEGCPKKVSLNFQLKEVFLLRQCACIYIISKYDMWEQLVVGHTDSLPAYIYQPHGLSHAYLFRGEVSSFVAISSFFWADKCRNSIKALKQGTAFAFWRQDKNITLIANIVHFAWHNKFPGKPFQLQFNWIQIIKKGKLPLQSLSLMWKVPSKVIQSCTMSQRTTFSRRIGAWWTLTFSAKLSMMEVVTILTIWETIGDVQPLFLLLIQPSQHSLSRFLFQANSWIKFIQFSQIKKRLPCVGDQIHTSDLYSDGKQCLV